MTKKSLNNILYRKLSLNCKQHFKIRKEHVLMKCLFHKVLQYLLYCKDIVKSYYIKGVHRVKKLKKKTSVRRCFTKLWFFKVLQNSQENTCVGVTL